MALRERIDADRGPCPEPERIPLEQPSRKRILLTAIVMVLLAAGACLLIGQVASFARIGSAIANVGPVWLVAAACASVLAYLGYALLYGRFVRLDDGPRPGARLILRLTVAIFGASVIATSAGRLGSEYWSLRRMHERPGRAWSRALALNTATWAVLAALAFGSALFLVSQPRSRTPLSLELAWLVVLPACALPAAYLASTAHRGREEAQTEGGGRIRRLVAAVVGSLLLVRRSLVERDLWALLGALCYWGGDLLVLWSALAALGVRLGLAALVLGYATGYASTMLPLPAGGAGGVDAASTYALTLVGVPLSKALLATLVLRVCTYWLPLLVAIALARSLKRLPGDLAAAPGPRRRVGLVLAERGA